MWFMYYLSYFLSFLGVSGHFLVGNEFNHVQSYHLLLSKPQVKHIFTPRNFLISLVPKKWVRKPNFFSFCRFRAGFRHAFAWCPFIKVSEEDKMELQHTHTFRVTMTRSHRKNSSHTRASIKSNTNPFDTNLAVPSELNTKRDACLKLKKHTLSKTYSTNDTRVVKRLDDTKSTAAKLMGNNHWQLNHMMIRTSWMGGQINRGDLIKGCSSKRHSRVCWLQVTVDHTMVTHPYGKS